MAFNNQLDPQKQMPEAPLDLDEQYHASEKELPANTSQSAAVLEQLEALPHRNRVLHWSAFVFSLISLILLSMWVFSPRGAVPTAWIWLDVGLSVVFGVEFFTRSGFQWTRTKYLRTHFFDFVAIIPALILVHHGLFLESAWVWLILLARAARVLDRFLGDGFIRRTFWALVEGFEEEITDRVLGNIITRLQSDMDQAGFSRGIAEALIRNKTSVLQRIRSATPREGVVPKVAHLVKLDAALERAEERAYDAIVSVISSQEIDHAVRDVVNSAFSRVRNELIRKSWKQKIQFRQPWL